MSEPTKPAEGAAAPAPQDEIKNLKSEMNRKLEAMNEGLKQNNAALINQIQSILKPPKAAPVAEDEPLEDLMYKAPDKFADRIAQRATSAIEQRLASRDAETTKRNDVVQALYKDFPELGNADHDLTKKSLEKYNELVKESGATPASYRAAVFEAAAELGVKPKKQRPADQDDFTGFSGQGSGNSSRGAKKEDKLSPETIEMAKLMGVDPEKVKTRAGKRSNFGKWE